MKREYVNSKHKNIYTHMKTRYTLFSSKIGKTMYKKVYQNHSAYITVLRIKFLP